MTKDVRLVLTGGRAGKSRALRSTVYNSQVHCSPPQHQHVNTIGPKSATAAATNMDLVPIAELRPELPGLESKQIKAVVSLLWPYSSSTRQFALLLAEPDFRLRHKKGQTRVRFTRSCAKAIAATGIGIGDTVILALQGAQFVEKDTEIRTPGRSIDWELSFSQTLVIQVCWLCSAIAADS